VNTVAWLLILGGIIIARQVARGRVMNLPEDLGDAFIAFASGDSDALGVVLTRTGDSATPSAPTPSVGAPIDNPLTTVGNISAAAVQLGERAKGYRWAATGPDYYDCSGLMWRACQAVGYKGSRFSTATIRGRKDFKIISAPGTQGPNVTAAGINDIVLWPAGSGGVTGHMGVMTGADKFYSARSLRSGIGETKISTFRKPRPIYLRYVGPRNNTISPFK
jgi:cell wall-associated NlpC family hydrolase